MATGPSSISPEEAASRLLLLRPDDDRDSPGPTPAAAPLHELATLRPLVGAPGVPLVNSGPPHSQQQALAQLSPITSNMLSQPLPPQAKMQVLAEAACSRSPQQKLVRRPAAGSRRPAGGKAQSKALVAPANQLQQTKVAQNHKLQRQHQQAPNLTGKFPVSSSNLVLTPKPTTPTQQQTQRSRPQQQQVLFKLGTPNNKSYVQAGARLVANNATSTTTIGKPSPTAMPAHPKQQQAVHNNRLGQLSPQTMAMIQQQVVVGASPKQPGSVRTLVPQKPAAQKRATAASLKMTATTTTTPPATSINAGGINNVVTSCAQAIPAINALHHKPAGGLKTLAPLQQQPVNVGGVVASPVVRNAVVQQRLGPQQIKMQIHQQVVQHKQVVATPAMQYPQQQVIRTQSVPSKNLTPVEVAAALRRDAEIKAEIKTEVKSEVKTELKNEIKEEEINFLSQTTSQLSTSPQRRMPLPYECLQFVLQDHNYGAPPPRTPPPPSPTPLPKQQQQPQPQPQPLPLPLPLSQQQQQQQQQPQQHQQQQLQLQQQVPQQQHQQPVNGTASACLTSQHPYIFNQATISNTAVEDDAGSAISSEAGREVEPEGEETETAPEAEAEDEDSVTRCICDFVHDDGYMICCDKCLVWQHVDCMGIDRANIPDEYLCELCRPRRVDRARARALQMRKREELLNSDTSSDSSSSSGDAERGHPANAKGRKAPQQQQQSVARRKPDSSSQSRRLNNNNNNNNVAKRQRRDTQSRQASNNRNKKEATAPTTTPQQQTTNKQKAPAKRKPKRRASLEDKTDESPDAWGSNMAPLRHWIERYEEAVTNHYSPELRAKISSIKINGTHNDLKQNNISAAATGKCRLNIQSNNHRYLVSTMYLPPNTPVVELRGKYMLSTQHRPSHPQSRQHAQRPGPFVFFYRLPRDGTEVCVDTRTYGNEARFIRRSCKPNAEVKHCIEKGTLHLYIVTTTAIEKNVEITIRHDQHDLLLSPNSNSAMLPILCACNNVKDCQVANLTAAPVANKKGANGPLAENADGRERRRRGRKNTVTDENEVEAPTASPSQPVTRAITPTPSIAPAPVQPSAKKTVTINANVSPIKESPLVNSSVITSHDVNNSPISTPAVTRSVAKEEQQHQATVAQSQSSSSSSQLLGEKSNKLMNTLHTPPQQTHTETKKEKDKKKMTREERKMEAIMKAFERLEKAEQRKQEAQARNAQRKESGTTHSDNEDSGPGKPRQNMSDKPPRRKRRKGRTRSTSTSQSQGSRRSRLNSADSDLTSGDESGSMQSPPPSQNCSYALRMHGSKDIGNSSNSQAAAGLLLALANSNATGSSSPTQQQHHHHQHHHHHRHPTPVKSPSGDSGASSSSQSSTPSTPLSSACLLVAAAVGPLAPGFKFPKTKKLLMNEWLKETPETQSHGVELSTNESSEFLSQNYASKGLATLVQAASSVSNVCDSTPQKVCSSAPTGSAKKRWLRQAISEECDSPSNSRPDSPPTNDRVAPPKKRRIARESLSSDNYTPPTTPTMMHQDHMPPHRPSINEDDFIDQMPSPSTEDVGSQNEYDSDQIKDESKSRFIMKDEVDSICKVNSPNLSNFPRARGDKKFLSPTNVKEAENEADNKSKLNTSMESPISSRRSRIGFCEKFEHKVVKVEEEEILRGTVEIVDQNDQDLETDEFSSPIAAMESEAELKKRVAELSLEFGGGIAALGNLSSDLDGSFQNQNESSCVKSEQDRFDDTSIDEFDVEAQMKKITGYDGDDYKEKMDESSERDKSLDGIEGLMESSQEDSESDKEDESKDENFQESIDESNEKFNEKMIEDNSANAEQNFENNDSKNRSMSSVEEPDDGQQSHDLPENGPTLKRDEPLDSLEKMSETPDSLPRVEYNDHSVSVGTQQNEQNESAAISALEESMMELDSMELPVEDIPEEPVKIFPSIPPLSERIRKKTDSNPAPKSKLEMEAIIIESSLDPNLVSNSENFEDRDEISTAFKELLEAKIEPADTPIPEFGDESKATPIPEFGDKSKATPIPEFDDKSINHKSSEKLHNDSIVIESKQSIVEKTPISDAVPSVIHDEQVTQALASSTKKEEVTPPEPKRLKDPRTAVPNKKGEPAPIKRKLSITEYRKRMQQSSETPSETDNLEMAAEGKGATRDRSDSASSGTSSLSSDEEGPAKAPLDIPNLNTLPIFANTDTDDKKGLPTVGDDGTMGWSAAPTLVERQRENLTERLKREFGLFLNDDEEERARKLAMSADAASIKSTAVAMVNCTNVSYPPPQLPPHPYIPPPGSAPIHFTQFPPPPKPTHPPVGPFPDYSVPPPSMVNPNYPPPPIVKPPIIPVPVAAPTAQPFVLPQAPPGSNPYPPTQFSAPPPPVPSPVVVLSPATTTVSISRFSPATVQPQPPLQTPPPVQPVIAYTVPPPPIPQVQKAAYTHTAPRS